MRRRKGSTFSSGHRSTLAWLLLAAALVLFLFAGVPGCMAQRMVWSTRGTMIFVPSGSGF